MLNKLTIKLEPPNDTNGRGTPVNGNKPIIEAILIKACTANQIIIPKANNLAKLSLLSLIILKPLSIKKTNKERNNKEKTKPNSSAIIAKIESPAGSGK